MTNEERTAHSKQFIIETIIPEFAKKGFDRVSLSQFCTDNKISKGRMYHHFQSKEQLYLACAKCCLEKLENIFNDFEPNPLKTYEENLTDYFIKSHLFFAENLARTKFMEQLMKSTQPEIKEIYEKSRKVQAENSRKTLIRILENASLQRGVSQNIAMDIFVMASRYVHSYHGFINWDNADDVEKRVDEGARVFRETVKILLYGVLPRD